MLASLSLVLLSLASSSLAAVAPSADVAAAAGVPASNNIVITKPHFHAPTKPMSRFAKHRPHRRSVVAERSKSSNSTKTEDVEKKTSSDSGYKIAEHWAGSTFFDDWTFYDSRSVALNINIHFLLPLCLALGPIFASSCLAYADT